MEYGLFHPPPPATPLPTGAAFLSEWNQDILGRRGACSDFLERLIIN